MEELLSEIQKAFVGAKDMPQGLTSLGSVLFATPGISEVRLVWL